MNKYIGGNLSWIERQCFMKRLQEKGILIHSTNWKNQCFCGNFTIFRKYRGRIYCNRCGMRYENIIKDVAKEIK